jgi:hypothetical protein
MVFALAGDSTMTSCMGFEASLRVRARMTRLLLRRQAGVGSHEVLPSRGPGVSFDRCGACCGMVLASSIIPKLIRALATKNLAARQRED